MGKIRSSISSNTHSDQSHQQQKVFTVDDDFNDGNFPSIVNPTVLRNKAVSDVKGIDPNEVKMMREKAARTADSQASYIKNAQTRIELITGIGRKTRDVEVLLNNELHVFSLRSLKGKEKFCLLEKIENAQNARLANGDTVFLPTSLYDIKIEALKHSLYAIDNIDINVVLGVANIQLEEQLVAREDLLHDMDEALTSHLFREYEKLDKEIRDGYDQPKTVKEAEEVAEAITKSSKAI